MEAVKNKIVDYKENQADIEKWFLLKGENKYDEYAEILENNGVEITWGNLSGIYRYDKRILFNLFKYFSMFEEYLRAVILLENISAEYKQVTNLTYSKLMKTGKEYLIKHFDYEKLEKTVKLRNQVAHTRIIIGNAYNIEAIKLMKELLPTEYIKGFCYDINVSPKDLSIAEKLIIEI